jgi:predicted HTH transcriptional regulator
MTDQKIINLINQARRNRTETSSIEFKDARGGFSKNIWNSVCAFSHRPNGGMIVFGIKEDRKNCVIDVVDNLNLALLQEKIANFLKQEIVNCGEHEIRLFDYENKKLLALIINETPDEKKPCYLKNVGLPKGACIRDGNINRAITDEEMKAYIRNASTFKYDKTKAIGTDRNDLIERKIIDFLRKSADRVGRTENIIELSNKVLKNVGIIDCYDEKWMPTVAGFLIFGNNPQQYINFSRYIVRAVRYQGNTAATSILDRQEITGPLDEQINTMQSFVLRNIAQKSRIVGIKRFDQYEYPEDAIRELIANAVIHRDYQITETYTQINIFSNRIEISNPGNLPPGVTVENIKEAQFSRNEYISRILKDMDYLEEYGRGIDIVFSKMKEWNLLEPIFKNTSNKFSVILLGPSFKELNSRQTKIWQLLQERKSITRKDCQNIFPNISKPTLINDLKKLTSVNLIIQKGAGISTYYESIY